MEGLNVLLENAKFVYNEYFPPTTLFERALFYSWSCASNDCKYCYMSTKPRLTKEHHAVRSQESILAETILCTVYGWKVGFVSGGIRALSIDQLKKLLKNITTITGERVWINAGVMSKSELEALIPYIIGVTGSVESVNEKVHEFICPTKPIAPIRRMFQNARDLGLKTGMTLILGVGETKNDFDKLKQFIEEEHIEKIHIYGLNPVKRTYFENTQSPSAEYHAWWISKTRINFPHIDIQCGIWQNKVNHVSVLLQAGANSISKFPVLKKFGSEEAKEIEKQATLAGRTFLGTLTQQKTFEVDEIIDKMPDDQKDKIRKHIKLYTNKIERNLKTLKIKVQHGIK
ncbi:radical SAM protein [Candidatus Woesearchaeota archaeon]|nr:radical SAM protein [Candidatus Woesearchaeota archaeon]